MIQENFRLKPVKPTTRTKLQMLTHYSYNFIRVAAKAIIIALELETDNAIENILSQALFNDSLENYLKRTSADCQNYY
ncbi:6335_t:CDS:2 [Funneliformis mosseae]|uniref:6335_t:CDS:1 n=1 Tax=Funneliformis mosseae TaxID=27381 RepID=A0A9N8ZST8_FUNMO|nr:6335_t:CDS:2 [Funneliformis mosseae]